MKSIERNITNFILKEILFPVFFNLYIFFPERWEGESVINKRISIVIVTVLLIKVDIINT